MSRTARIPASGLSPGRRFFRRLGGPLVLLPLAAAAGAALAWLAFYGRF